MTRLKVRYIYSLHRINRLKRKLGHQSLVKDGEILHRDVSINNIMITDKQCEGKPKGFLIDLDLAKVIGSEGSGSVHRTGTMEFMAINVLLRIEPHSYRHDLESFFYVLIWICVFYELTGYPHYILDANNKQRLPDVLSGWSRADAAGVKHLQMFHEKAFQRILDEFSDGFKELESMVREVRHALFPLRQGVGSEPEYDQLYDLFLRAIQRQLDKMSK